jgi:hypothetical protein
MKVELTTVKLEGLQILGAKTQHHLTQKDHEYENVKQSRYRPGVVHRVPGS